MEKQEQQSSSAYRVLTRYMEQKAMRKTPERYEVLRIVELTDGIFTIDDLMLLMQEKGSFKVSRATLFNTMNLLCDAGIVIKHPLAVSAHYELRVDDMPKAYAICRQCNSIRKVSVRTVKLALQNMRIRYFNRDDTLVYVHGLCQGCQAKKRNQERKRQKHK